MKLPVPAFLDKIQHKQKQSYFLALLLRDEKAVAIVLEELDGSLRLIGRAEEQITQPIEDIPYEELLSILDKTISQAEETLPPQIQTEKTIFGIKETWVEDKKIKKEYLTKLKKVCDALSLTPIGFMVVSEAISHLLQQEEGAPLSAILAEIGKKNITLSLFRAGKLIESHHGVIEGTLPQVVDRLLHHFTTHVLPSRIILFNGGSEELGQEFIAHHWSPGLPFLHVPQIAVLPHEFDGKAMIVGVAEQLGFNVAGNLGDMKIHDLGTSHDKGHHQSSHASHLTNDDQKESENSETDIPEHEKSEDEVSSPSTAEQFGFMVGKDVADSAPEIVTRTKNEQVDDLHSKSLHESISTIPHRQEHDNLRIPDDIQPSDHHENTTLAEEEVDKSSNNFRLPSVMVLGKIPSIVTSFLTRFPKLPGLSLATLPGGNRLLLTLPIVLILIGGLVILYLTSLKATITLAVQPQIVRENEAITLAAGKSNNYSKGTLAARSVEIALEGEQTTKATGKKEVGEKAKGTITLFNSSESKKSLSKGTSLTASNGREFVTEEDVTVASASGDIFSGIKSGTAKVNVIAKEIGQEYNLPSNTKFSVEGSTTVAGKNESAFSGGSKKEITVVAQSDIKELTESLPKKLEEQAKKQLASKVQNGEAVLGIFTDISMDEKTTNYDAGDEAKEVTLKAKISYKTLSYKESDIADLAKSTLNSTDVQNLTLSDKSLKTKLKDVEVESEDEVSTSVEMEGGLLPRIDPEKITEQVKGKSFTDAQEFLAGLSQVKNAEITLSPNLPFLPKFLPRKANNIEVEVVSND